MGLVRLFVLVWVIAFGGLPITAWAGQPGEPAGKVLRVQGSAVALLDAQPRTLAVGTEVRVGDILSTGANSRLEVELGDGSTLFLGERASFNVIAFSSPKDGGEMVLRLLSGAFSAVSGAIAKQGGRMDIETPVATIGIRGTTVWGGQLDGDFQVALLDGTRAVVTTRGGRVDLMKVGDGTLIKNQDTAPAPPKKWGGNKLERAKATVAFR
ncbi:FecR domain-containing protein [Magnetospira sp. QH-2]|uniref:FecR family protein n=1 Tax=Magnetospira sp. (strain QH-2) TaxID=1288970 RepID=UPI0003E812CA|nr:FecR family protein [Magnetospira sp. QH-2]CCQ74852.1 conserved exported protein of unknown function [Magnetospira sp. QH-2]